MKHKLRNVAMTAFLLSGVGWVAPANAALAPGEEPWIIEEQAIETASISMVTNKEGRIVEVVIDTCASCKTRSFPVDPAAEFSEKGHPLDHLQAYKRNRHAGTVIYSVKTQKVTKLILFPKGGN